LPLKPDIESPVLRSFVQIWRDASDNGALPVKTKLDPVELARIGVMPIVWLLERRDGELYCRLAGEDIGTAVGRPTRGRKISEVYDSPSSDVIIEQWNRILDREESCHNKGVIIASLGRRFVGERIALPMANAEGEARFILGATFYRKLHGLYPVEEMASSILKEPAVFTPYRDIMASFAGPA